jgi:transcriptional regulator with XRE-family HTH domain
MPKPPKHVVLSKKELGARLRAIRLKHGMTQQELARTMGTHFTTISAVERGVRALTLQQVAKLASTLRVSPDDLLHPRQRSTPAPPSRREGRLLRRVERIRELPSAQQQTVLDVLESLLKTHGQGNGRPARDSSSRARRDQP